MIKDDNVGNICKNCGMLYGYDYTTEYIDFHLDKYKIYKKSLYHWEYHLYKNIDLLINDKKYQISCSDREKVIKIFNEMEKILPEINQSRKRIININFLFKKTFNALKIDVKIPISKSKNTISKYENYWEKIQLLIGDKIRSIVNK